MLAIDPSPYRELVVASVVLHVIFGVGERRGVSCALVLAANEVGIDNFAFTPQVLRVAIGTTVTWINKDDVPHVIVNTQLKFPASKVLDPDQRYSHTFTRAGVYDYYCSIHPTMTGKVVVG